MLTASVRSLAARQSVGTARYHCPQCSALRRNKHDRPLSVTRDDADHLTYLCHHCGCKGGLDMDEPKPFHAPTPSVASDGDNIAFNYLASRGITRATAMAAGVVYEPEHEFRGDKARALGFPYMREGKPYAVKWRGIDSKGFNQTGAAATLWGIERIEPGTPLVITEGEIDALSFWQAGIPAVSVPNGAPQVVSSSSPKADDKKYLYLQHAEALINEAERIVIATDGDAQGEALAEELARRLGRGKCWKVRWPEGCKDANAVLTSHGPLDVRKCVEEAEPWPVKGLYDAAHFAEAVDALYAAGLVRGQSTGFDEVDEIYTVLPGQLSIVTGIPSMGKSAFLDQLSVNLAQREGWRFALCSFENQPRIHIAKLMQLYTRKPFFHGLTPRMGESDKVHAGKWVQDHYSFLFQGDGQQATIDDILDRLRSAVLRYGIRGAIIDPANFIDRNRDMNETDWVSDALTKLKVFVMAHDLHIWFVAHPTKQYRQEDGKFRVPGGYDISGSSHWFNKADMGLSVHRPDLKTNSVEIHCWKCRYSWAGKQGHATLNYDVATGCYMPADDKWKPTPSYRRGSALDLN